MQQISKIANAPVLEPHFWAVENIRSLPGLGDLSVAVRRQLPYGDPDRIFNIYVQHGVVKTASRAYPDYQEKKWTNEFDIGAGNAVAISFDGYYRLYDEKWRFVTDEFPYLFWVDDNSKLWTQIWEDSLNKLELSSNVLKVKAMRAWKNPTFQTQDQGLVACYIKNNGKAYYRNYCRQVDGRYTWETEREIEEFTGTAININMFNTNDYRMGFAIEDNLSNIHFLITERSWAGMAIAPQTISVAPAEIIGTLIPIEYPEGFHTEYLSLAPTEIIGELLFALTTNEILNISNVPVIMLDETDEEYENWGWVIEFEVENPIPSLALAQAVFSSVETGLPIGISSIELIGDNKYEALVDPLVEAGINNIFGDIRLTISNSLNPAGYIYNTMIKSFTPINLVPEFIPLPEVDEVWNE